MSADQVVLVGRHEPGKPRPLADRVVLRMLRSPLRVLLGQSLMGLRIRGLRSGLWHELPVQYAQDGTVIVVYPSGAERKRWWRNLRSDSDVQVLLLGRWVAGRAVALTETDARYTDALRRYWRRWPSVRFTFGDPMVWIDLDR